MELLFYSPFFAVALFMLIWSVPKVIQSIRKILNGKKASGLLFNIVLMIFGLVIFVAMSFAYNSTLEEKKEEASFAALKTEGFKVTIPIKDVYVEKEDTNAGDKYYIYMPWFDKRTGDSVTFEDGYYRFDPSEQLAKQTDVVIYVDKNNRDRYLVNLSVKAHTVNVTSRLAPEDSVPEKGWTMFLFGLVVCAGMGFLLYNSFAMVRYGDKSIATVLYLVGRSDDQGYVYYPFIRFTTPKGKIIELELAEGSNPPAFKEGDEFPVFYEPGKPQNVLSITYQFIIVEFVFLYIGVILVVAGVSFLV